MCYRGIKLNSDEFEGLSYDRTSDRAFSLEKWKLCTGTFLIFCKKNHNEMSYFRSVYLGGFFSWDLNTLFLTYLKIKKTVFTNLITIKEMLYGVNCHLLRDQEDIVSY